jgi:hypothetical protein
MDSDRDTESMRGHGPSGLRYECVKREVTLPAPMTTGGGWPGSTRQRVESRQKAIRIHPQPAGRCGEVLMRAELIAREFLARRRQASWRGADSGIGCLVARPVPKAGPGDATGPARADRDPSSEPARRAYCLCTGSSSRPGPCIPRVNGATGGVPEDATRHAAAECPRVSHRPRAESPAIVSPGPTLGRAEPE